MSAHAIDNRENAAIWIDVIAVLVMRPAQACIAFYRRPQMRPDRHQRLSRTAVSSASAANTASIAISTMVRPMSKSFIEVVMPSGGFPLQIDYAGEADGGAARQFGECVLPHWLAVDRGPELAHVFNGETARLRVAANAAMLARDVG